MTSQLTAHNLIKHYKNRPVVNGASFSVQSAQVVGLLGPNGAGKTTSFYLTIGLIRPDSGSIYLDQTNLTPLPMHKRAQLGLSYLPQEASVFRKLSVRDNILAILELTGRHKRKQRLQYANQLMQELNISHLADTLGISLSGGERRRCEIARTLATQPRFILLDEPFAGVDPIAVADIRHIIDHLRQRQIGILITDHNVRETLKSCDHAYILSEGRILASGSPQELINNPQARSAYLGNDFSLS